MKLLKFVGGTILTVLLLFVFVIHFSVVESRLECPGNIFWRGSSRSVTVYVRFERYRWWIWGPSDGAMHLEIPHTTVDYFGYIIKIGDQYAIFDSLTPPRHLKGGFSALSGALSISTSTGFFEGRCHELTDAPIRH